MVAAKVEFGDRFFDSVEEAREWIKGQSELIKQGRQVLKELSPVKKPSIKSKVAEELAKLLNSDATMLNMAKEVKQNFQMRVRWNGENETFTVPDVRRAREPGNNSVHMGATPLTVDGVEYKSAASAIHTVCPETAGNPYNRKQAIRYMRHEDHGSHNVVGKDGE